MNDRWSHQDLAEILARRSGAAITPKSVTISREVKTDYKAQFEQQLSLVGINFETEYFFALPERKFRADYRIGKVLVEFEGGLFAKNKIGHGNVKGILRDMVKTNEAQLRGFILIRIAPNHVVSGEALQWVERAIVLDQLGLTSQTSLDKPQRPKWE